MVLAHDMSEEPRFTYANQAALDLFEGSWEEIIGMESKKSADPETEVSPGNLPAHVPICGLAIQRLCG